MRSCCDGCDARRLPEIIKASLGKGITSVLRGTELNQSILSRRCGQNKIRAGIIIWLIFEGLWRSQTGRQIYFLGIELTRVFRRYIAALAFSFLLSLIVVCPIPKVLLSRRKQLSLRSSLTADPFNFTSGNLLSELDST